MKMMPHGHSQPPPISGYAQQPPRPPPVSHLYSQPPMAMNMQQQQQQQHSHHHQHHPMHSMPPPSSSSSASYSRPPPPQSHLPPQQQQHQQPPHHHHHPPPPSHLSSAMAGGNRMLAGMPGPSAASAPPPPPTNTTTVLPTGPTRQSTIANNAAHPLHKLAAANEQTWVQLGHLSETLGDLDRAMMAYDAALRHNPYSVPALTQIATLCRAREQFPLAIEFFQRILNIEGNNGEIWGALGHCYLMMDDLPKAYASYQQALYHLPNPKEPKLWYGIGILYDRYGSFEHAEEAFNSVLKMDPQFEKANEIQFRLGIIFKQQGKFDQSLRCFRAILANPPKPLTDTDIRFQIGHVFEQQKDYTAAREAYEQVLKTNANHAKVLQQLGWLLIQPKTGFTDLEKGTQLLTRSMEVDNTDAQTWYLLGRCYMLMKQYTKAYEMYQQAVYRDGRNPVFWCSIGVLYFTIGQSRDALDAYSRAIRLNPYIPEIWFNLGALYESCNNQVQDALDAYVRALELDPNATHIQQRLQWLRQVQANGGQPPAGITPPPAATAFDINPGTYKAVPPQGAAGGGAPPGGLRQSNGGPAHPPQSTQQQPLLSLQTSQPRSVVDAPKSAPLPAHPRPQVDIQSKPASEYSGRSRHSPMDTNPPAINRAPSAAQGLLHLAEQAVATRPPHKAEMSPRDVTAVSVPHAPSPNAKSETNSTAVTPNGNNSTGGPLSQKRSASSPIHGEHTLDAEKRAKTTVVDAMQLDDAANDLNDDANDGAVDNDDGGSDERDSATRDGTSRDNSAAASIDGDNDD